MKNLNLKKIFGFSNHSHYAKVIWIIVLILIALPIVYSSGTATLGDSYIATASDVDEGIYGDGGTWRWHDQKATCQTGTLTNISYWTMLGGTGGNPLATTLNITIWSVTTYPTLVTKLCDFAQVPNTIGWSTTITFRNISGNCAITYEGTCAIVLSSDQTAASVNNQFEKGRTTLSGSRNNAYGGPYGGTWTSETQTDPFALWYNSSDVALSDTTPPIGNATLNSSSIRIYDWINSTINIVS